jgi:hypothetical protein
VEARRRARKTINVRVITDLLKTFRISNEKIPVPTYEQVLLEDDAHLTGYRLGEETLLKTPERSQQMLAAALGRSCADSPGEDLFLLQRLDDKHRSVADVLAKYILEQNNVQPVSSPSDPHVQSTANVMAGRFFSIWLNDLIQYYRATNADFSFYYDKASATDLLPTTKPETITEERDEEAEEERPKTKKKAAPKRKLPSRATVNKWASLVFGERTFNYDGQREYNISDEIKVTLPEFTRIFAQSSQRPPVPPLPEVADEWNQVFRENERTPWEDMEHPYQQEEEEEEEQGPIIAKPKKKKK